MSCSPSQLKYLLESLTPWLPGADVSFRDPLYDKDEFIYLECHIANDIIVKMIAS